MNEINIFLMVFLFGTSLLLGIYFYLRRFWIGVALVGAYLVRVLFGAVFQGEVQYNFVLDSLGYEYRAWLLAQKWMASDVFASLNRGYFAEYNIYEAFLSHFFKIFGKELFLAKMINSFFATLTIFFIYKIQCTFFRPHREGRPSFYLPELITCVLLGLYPSFVVWSASNIRDPMYFLATAAFFYFFLRIVSTRPRASVAAKILSSVICGICYWVVIDLRSYVAPIFIISLVAGVLIFHLNKMAKIRSVFFFGISFLIFAAYLYQFVAPSEVAKLLSQLQSTRLSFANLNLLDSVAKSSFGLDTQFKSVTDALLFLPTSLSHYFFGPFPWEVVDVMQAVSLVEAFPVYFLVYPCWVGICFCYRTNRFSTVLLLSFVGFFVTAQSFVISNMGTIFRHRTLTFLFLSIFAGQGLGILFYQKFPVLRVRLQRFFDLSIDPLPSGQR